MDIQTQAKTFARDLEKLDRSKSVREKFRDFCEMAYCAIAKTTALTPERADALEAQYMKIVETYRDKDTVRAYPELLARVALAVEDYHDFLGIVSAGLNFLSKDQGQFFTPMSVSLMMARMMLAEAGTIIDENGYVSLLEPAAGAGGMVLAAARVIREQEYVPAEHMLVQAIDLSVTAYHMCYVQLSLAGIPAGVIRGNSLSLEQFESAWTPGAILFYGAHGHLDFDNKKQDAPHPALIPAIEMPSSADMPRQLRLFD